MFAQLQSAATQAQRIFAQMGGAATPTTTNFTLGGTAYQGVLNEVRANALADGVGIETVRELHIVAERTQFASKPDAAPRPAVVALSANWYLTDVGESPLHYFLTCKPA
jgi:hypothetical protein